MSDLVYKLNTVSYYTLDGWVWCPDSPSAKVDVMLIDSSGVELASFVANRVCDTPPPGDLTMRVIVSSFMDYSPV